MNTLEEALRFREYRPEDIDIIREVRYYANIGGTRYVLEHNWTTEILEEKLRKLEASISSKEGA